MFSFIALHQPVRAYVTKSKQLLDRLFWKPEFRSSHLAQGPRIQKLQSQADRHSLVRKRHYFRVTVQLKSGQTRTALKTSSEDAACFIREWSALMYRATVEEVTQKGKADPVPWRVTEYKPLACARVLYRDGSSFVVKMPDSVALHQRLQDIPHKMRCEYFSELEMTSQTSA